MRSLPGFKVKEGKSSLLLQQIERNNANSAMASPGSKCIEDEDKGIAEILMLQQRTVLQVLRHFVESFYQKSMLNNKYSIYQYCNIQLIIFFDKILDG